MSGKRAFILRDEGPEAPDLSLETVGFRDFLRALGAELDEAQAAGVVLIRLQSELVLTYNYVASTEGYFWHKRHVIVDPTSAKRLLTAAHTRRRPAPPKSGLRGLFKRT